MNLISDKPIEGGSDHDSLGFGKYASVLANFARSTSGPFTFGVHAEWGYGKTSLLKGIEGNLKAGSDKDKIIPVWFNAWQFESEELPLIAMILTIINSIDDKLKEVEHYPQKAMRVLEKAKGALEAIGEGSIASLSFRSSIRLPMIQTMEVALSGKDAVDAARSRNTHENQDKQVQSQLRQKLDYYRSFEALTSACNGLESDGFKVVVLVDDLDRCTPEKAFKLLQDIKLVLSQPGFIFFMGLDVKALKAYIEDNYDDSGRYLDKLMQVPFHIPTHKGQHDNFIKELLEGIDVSSEKEVLDEVLRALSPALLYNPRAIKRVINTSLLLHGIEKVEENSNGSSEMLFFFVFEVFLRVYYPDFYTVLLECTDDSSLAMISLWGDYKDRDSDTTNAVEEKLWDVLSSESALRELFQSDIGRMWLSEENSENRLRARELTAEQHISFDDNADGTDELFTRAEIALADGRLDEGRSLLSRAIGIKPNAPEAYRRRAELYLREKNWEAAMRDLKQVVTLDQTDPAAVRELGRCYRKLDNDRRAISVLTRGIKRFPKHAGLLIERGTVYYQEANPKYELAIQDFEKAGELDSGNLEADLHYRWARTLWLRAGGKRADKKLRSTLVPKLKKALEIDPDYGRASDWLDALNGNVS